MALAQSGTGLLVGEASITRFTHVKAADHKTDGSANIFKQLRKHHKVPKDILKQIYWKKEGIKGKTVAPSDVFAWHLEGGCKKVCNAGRIRSSTAKVYISRSDVLAKADNL